MNEAQRRVLDIVRRNSALLNFADPTREVMLIENYTYSIDFMVGLASALRIQGNPVPQVSLSTGTTGYPPDIIMDSDSDFVLTDISAGCLANFATFQTKLQWNPALLMQITDKASGRTYFNRPTMVPLVAGFNGFPFMLPSPRVLKPRTTLHVDVTPSNTDNNQQFNGFFLCLHGAKIFYK